MAKAKRQLPKGAKIIKKLSLNEEIERLLFPEYAAFFRENPTSDNAYLFLIMQQTVQLNRIVNALKAL